MSKRQIAPRSICQNGIYPDPTRHSVLPSALAGASRDVRPSRARTRNCEEMVWEFEREEWSTPSLQAQLLDARLCGRHGSDRAVVLQFVHPAWFSSDDKALIYAAFEDGIRARQTGQVCFCHACITPLRQFPQADRIEYRSRRYAELTLAGVSDEEARLRISDELNTGVTL